ncbi:hypothetical protein MMC20_003710 [Loxospora ochrophaea]|nr:hypothetical protein [Loxospora ochrophaea]
MSTDSTSTLDFLAFPREIRDQIYKDLLIPVHPHKVQDQIYLSHSPGTTIFLINWQIHQEATEIIVPALTKVWDYQPAFEPHWIDPCEEHRLLKTWPRGLNQKELNLVMKVDLRNKKVHERYYDKALDFVLGHGLDCISVDTEMEFINIEYTMMAAEGDPSDWHEDLFDRPIIVRQAFKCRIHRRSGKHQYLVESCSGKSNSQLGATINDINDMLEYARYFG